MQQPSVKSVPGKNSGSSKEPETKRTKPISKKNVKGTKNKSQLTKRTPVNVKTTQLVALFVVTTGEKIALKAKYSGVHKNRVVTTPCYRHNLENEGRITKDKLLKFGLSACFASEGVAVSEGISFKIGAYQFHVYHIQAIELGGKILANPNYFFEEIKKLKRGKVVNLNGKDHTITKACRLTLASITKNQPLQHKKLSRGFNQTGQRSIMLAGLVFILV